MKLLSGLRPGSCCAWLAMALFLTPGCAAQVGTAQTSAAQPAAPVRDQAFIDRTGQAYELIEKARVLQHERRYQEALSLYQQGIKLDPNDNSAMLHNNIASVLQALGQIDQAEVEYRHALYFDPQLELARRNLDSCQISRLTEQARVLKLEHRYPESIALYRQAVSIDPQRAMSHNNLGTALQATGDLDSAIGEYRLALSLEPQMELATINLARCFLSEGKFAEAHDFFTKYMNEHRDGKDYEEAQQSLAALKGKQCEQADDLNTPDYYKSATSRGVLRWPPAHVIRVFIASGQGVEGFRPEMAQALVESFNEWTAAARGRIAWQPVPSTEQADLICTWASGNSGFAVRRNSPDAQGEVPSYSTFTENGEKFIRHTAIEISTFNAINGQPITVAEAKDVALHEVGHALGIVGHSPNFHDVMFFITNPGGGAVFRQISARDAATINKLYTGYPAYPATMSQ